MTVYLVGAGPGDPGLLTRRAGVLLGEADVVVHDRLVAPAVLDLARPGARLVDVGKAPAAPGAARPPAAAGTHGTGGRPRRSQSDITALLIELGRTGERVVRLKGGDPFVFGRGGEEAEALARAGVEYEVVPGVSSAFAAPAAAGIPVTHRGLATSVTVVTGHVGEPSGPDGVDWSSLGRAGGTLVILMGMSERARIADELVRSGRDRATPVAVVHWATTDRQRVERTTLDGLASVELPAPSVIVVGPVAGLDLGGGPAPAGPGGTGGRPR